MIKAIILDGYFAGTVVNHDGNPVLSMIKPATVTICYCYDDEPPTESESPLQRIDYKLAAIGFDDSAIYSLSGDLFKPMTEARDWVVNKRERPFHKDRPIYINCNDERAYQV